MLVLLLNYFIMYFCTYLLFFFYIFLFTTSKEIHCMPIGSLFNFFKQHKNTNIILFLIMLLSGLPPVSFFFFKVNLLIFIADKVNIIIYFLVLVNIIVGSFFYLQVFKTIEVSSNIPFMWKYTKHAHTILYTSSLGNSYALYSYYRLTLSFIFYNFLFLFFINDTFFICYLFY